jgi:hypothetical protein
LHPVQIQHIGHRHQLAPQLAQIRQLRGVELHRHHRLGELESFEEQEPHPHVAQVDLGVDGIQQDADRGRAILGNAAGEGGELAAFHHRVVLHRLEAQRRLFRVQRPAAGEGIGLCRDLRAGQGSDGQREGQCRPETQSPGPAAGCGSCHGGPPPVAAAGKC